MDPLLALVLRSAFALLFAAAALHKLRDFGRFRGLLASYELLPSPAAVRLAPLVPALEAGLALWLASGRQAALAGAATAMLLLLYGAAMQLNLSRGRRLLDCGCMGPAARVPLQPVLVLRNLLLSSAASLLMLQPSSRALGFTDFAVALLATASLSACWLASERLFALAPRAAELRAQQRRPAPPLGEPASRERSPRELPHTELPR